MCQRTFLFICKPPTHWVILTGYRLIFLKIKSKTKTQSVLTGSGGKWTSRKWSCSLSLNNDVKNKEICNGGIPFLHLRVQLGFARLPALKTNLSLGQFSQFQVSVQHHQSNKAASVKSKSKTWPFFLSILTAGWKQDPKVEWNCNADEGLLFKSLPFARIINVWQSQISQRAVWGLGLDWQLTPKSLIWRWLAGALPVGPAEWRVEGSGGSSARERAPYSPENTVNSWNLNCFFHCCIFSNNFYFWLILYFLCLVTVQLWNANDEQFIGRE